MTLRRTFRESDEHFFAKTAALGLRRFLETRGAQAHILTDSLHSTEIARNGLFSISCETSDPNIQLKHNILVLLHRHERQVLRQMAAHHSDKNILSVRHDVASSLLAGIWPLAPFSRPQGQQIRKYLILCNPRSGSTYLTEALSQLGVGEPREHLREETVYLFSNKSFRFAYFVDQLTKKAEHNGFFGTKVISHFFKSLFPHRSTFHLAARWLQRFDWKLIYLRRADKVDQALSAYFAKQTNLWHVEDGAPVVTEPPYDYGSIRRFYDHFVSWEEDLEFFTGLCEKKYGIPVLTISYDDLWRDPESSLEAILGFLGAWGIPRPRLDHSRLPKRVAAHHRSISVYKTKFLGDMGSQSDGAGG